MILWVRSSRPGASLGYLSGTWRHPPQMSVFIRVSSSTARIAMEVCALPSKASTLCWAGASLPLSRVGGGFTTLFRFAVLAFQRGWGGLNALLNLRKGALLYCPPPLWCTKGGSCKHGILLPVSHCLGGHGECFHFRCSMYWCLNSMQAPSSLERISVDVLFAPVPILPWHQRWP